MKKICPNCGAEFETECKQQKFCSHKCAQNYHNKLRFKNHHYHRKCKLCGAEFETEYKHKIFCSYQCTHLYHRRAYEERKKKHHRRICPNCGKEFDTTSEQKLFCSKKCQLTKRNERRRTNTIRRCAICGQEFKVSGKHRKFCGRAECQKKLHGRAEHLPVKCEMCGQEFIPSRNGQKYCSHNCCQRHYNQMHSEKLREEKIERLMPDEKVVEKVSMKDVAARYNMKMKIMEQHRQEELEKKRAKIRKDKTRQAIQRPVAEIQRPVVDVEEFEGSIGLADDFKPAEKIRQVTKPKPKNELEKRMAEAQECGLSYGQYIGYLRMGKTFEELKARNEKTPPVENENSALWWLNL